MKQNFTCRCGLTLTVPRAWPKTCACGLKHLSPTESEGKSRPPGPGDHLAAIFRQLHLEEKPGCGCAALRAKMNRLGVAGCREKIAELAAELEAKSALYGWGEQAAAGARALWAGLVNWSDPWAGLVEEACRRAEA